MAVRTEGPHPQRPATRRAGREPRTGVALLADRAGHPVAAGRAGLGCEGDRAAGARPAHGLPGHEGVFSPQPQVHAGVC